jgi:hypothetical protein
VVVLKVVMREAASLLVGFFVALLDAAAADQQQTFRSPTDYQRITALNPFGLVRQSPPQSDLPKTVSTNAPADLRLSGIASSASKKLAFFVQNERSKSAQYFSLAEGQKDYGVELLAIDLPAEIVKLRCGSTEFKLSLKSDTSKTNAAALPIEFRGRSRGASHVSRQSQ